MVSCNKFMSHEGFIISLWYTPGAEIIEVLCQILDFNYTSINRGRRRTMSKGRRDRTLGHPHLDHRRDRTVGHPMLHSCREPPVESSLCIELVNLEYLYF